MRARRFLAVLAAWSACLGIASSAIAAQDEGVAFEVRTGFEPRPLDAPLVSARWSGAGELAVAAVGDVRGRTVADIGAGRGRHVVGLSRAVGPAGRLYAIEVSPAGRDALRAVVDGDELGNVTVLLASSTDVGLEQNSLDVALLADVYPFVLPLDVRGEQDKHAFLTSLRRAVKPGGEVVVTYVTSDQPGSDQPEQEDTRRALLENTLADFHAYGFETGRRWSVADSRGPLLVLEFRWPADGPVSPREYLGRTIATTMHWKGAEWLLREEREQEEAGASMLAALDVQPGWSVADFGCGNGYYALKLAQLVGPDGRVFGVDIQPEMLTMLESRAQAAGLNNVEPLLGGALDAPLPERSCDLILLADVYHELSHPVPMLAVIRRALKPGGRVALLEFRAEDPEVPIKPLHKMSRAQILAEMEANGFQPDGSLETLPRQHLLFFRIAD